MSKASEARERIKARRATRSAKAKAADSAAAIKAKKPKPSATTKTTEMATIPILKMPSGGNIEANLPDNGNWENRFEVRSASSNRVYIIAQSKDKRHWGCSCMGWRRHRKCKHLTTVGLPNFEQPQEVQRMN